MQSSLTHSVTDTVKFLQTVSPQSTSSLITLAFPAKYCF